MKSLENGKYLIQYLDKNRDVVWEEESEQGYLATLDMARSNMRIDDACKTFVIIRTQLMFDSRNGKDWREQGHATGRFSDGKPYGGYI